MASKEHIERSEKTGTPAISSSVWLADNRSAELRREEFMRMAEGSVVAFRQAVEALFELRAILCDQTPENQEGEKEREDKESPEHPQSSD